jgi:hypothetical protein
MDTQLKHEKPSHHLYHVGRQARGLATLRVRRRGAGGLATDRVRRRERVGGRERVERGHDGRGRVGFGGRDREREVGLLELAVRVDRGDGERAEARVVRDRLLLLDEDGERAAGHAGLGAAERAVDGGLRARAAGDGRKRVVRGLVVLACLSGEAEEREEDDRADDIRPPRDFAEGDDRRVHAPHDRRVLVDLAKVEVDGRPGHPRVDARLPIEVDDVGRERDSEDEFRAREGHQAPVAAHRKRWVGLDELVELRPALHEGVEDEDGVDRGDAADHDRPDNDEEHGGPGEVDGGQAAELLVHVVAVTLGDVVEDHLQAGDAEADAEVDNRVAALVLTGDQDGPHARNLVEAAVDDEGAARDRDSESDLEVGGCGE